MKVAEGFAFQTLQTLQPDTKLIGSDGALGEQASCLLWPSQFQAMLHWESRHPACLNVNKQKVYLLKRQYVDMILA